MTADLRSYLVDYIKFYNSIQRRVFYDLLHKIPDQMGMSKYITHICNKYAFSCLFFPHGIEFPSIPCLCRNNGCLGSNLFQVYFTASGQ